MNQGIVIILKNMFWKINKTTKTKNKKEKQILFILRQKTKIIAHVYSTKIWNYTNDIGKEKKICKYTPFWIQKGKKTWI